MNKSLSQVAAIGIKKACHFFAKWAAPKSPIAPSGEKFGICGIIRLKAATKMNAVKTPKGKFNFCFSIFNGLLIDIYLLYPFINLSFTAYALHQILHHRFLRNTLTSLIIECFHA